MTSAQTTAKATAAESTLREFLDSLAAGTSTPGGGGAAALTGSQAAALISMVLNFTVGREKYVDVEEELRTILDKSEELRETLLDLIDADAAAFQAVSACYSMPQTSEEEKATRSRAIQEALKGATEVPYEIAEQCFTVLQLAKPVAEKGNPNVVSDAATAAHLAFSGLLSSVANVNINLKYIKDEGYAEEWGPRAEQLMADARTAYDEARAACRETLGVPV